MLHAGRATTVSGGFARAVVVAAGVTTEYIRAGAGTPLVFVTSDLEASDGRATIEWLARRHLVIAAAPGADGADAIAAWLREFTEGLGITGAHVFFDASVAGPVLTGD